VKRVPYTPQMEVTECGAASLAMVLAYHGHHASLPEIRQACGVSRDGANALAIVRAARTYGLDAKGAKLGMAQLCQLPLPAILHWDFNHFLVLERLTRKKAHLVDPACGRRGMSLAEVSRHFTGVALIFSTTTAFQRKPRSYPSLAKYRDIFRESLPSLGQVLLASLALQLVGLTFPVANQLLLDRVIGPRQDAWLWGLAFGLGGAVIARALLALVRSYVVQGLQNVLDFTLMGRFLDHLLRLPLAFFLQREAGDLVQRVQSNATIRNLLGSQSISALLDGFLLMGYASLMLAYNPKLGLVVLAFGAGRVGLLLGMKNRNQQIMASELAAAGREGGALVEALTGLETTKAAGAEGRMVQRWAHRMTQRVNAGLERRRLGIWAAQAMILLQGGTTAAVFLVGGQEVLAQRMTMGVFASFLALQSLFMGPLGSLLEALTQLQFLGNHLRRLDDVLDTAREPTGNSDPGRLRGAIELWDVSFSYAPGAPPVIQNVSLGIQPGEKVALVGPSGAGKSTLARLLLGMHIPSAGTIAFDGRDLRDLDLQKLRNQMGVVLQETFLFDDTVRANLSLNDDHIPLERLRWAARMACVEDVIGKLPGGFAGRVGENGCLLSGGERQRLNLARAIAHDPAILLLDEATSSLDLETEARLHANLASLGCTRIVIAHRMATVRDADRILVLRDGRIVQAGTFVELEAQEGSFQALVPAKEPVVTREVALA
jgi:ATP-binding cassette, subfamily B, bacterial